MTELIRVAAIRTNGGTQSRAELNASVVEDYAEAIKAGAKFPPMVVFYDGEHNWLADGFHRHAGYTKAGVEMVGADVRQGSRRDAILFSAGANAIHGLRRSNADKRRAIETLLRDEEWGAKGDRWIAEKCGVDHKTVGRLRAELASTGEVPQLKERIGRDGKTRALPAKPASANHVPPSAQKAQKDAPEHPEGAEPESVAAAEPVQRESAATHVSPAAEAQAAVSDPLGRLRETGSEDLIEAVEDGRIELDEALAIAESDNDEDEWDPGLAVEPIYEVFDSVMSDWPEGDPAHPVESALARCLKRLEVRRERMQG